MNLLALLLVSAAIAPGEGGSADLAVSQTKPDAPRAVIGGQVRWLPVTYTVTVTNNGPGVAFNTHVTDTPSDPVTATSASSGSCSTTAPVECDLGDLQPGQSATVTVETQPPSGDGGPRRNSATARSQTPDPEPANDTSTVDANIVFVEQAPPPDRDAPRATITGPKNGTKARTVKSFSGFASDARGKVANVEIAVRRRGGSGCTWLAGSGATFTTKPKTAGACADQVWLKASGTDSWRYALTKKLPKGSYVVIARATDDKGNVARSYTAAARSLVAFKVR